MAIKIKHLVKKLQDKDQEAEVEFVVIKTNGTLVCMDVKSNTYSMMEVLSMFSSGKPKETK